MHISCFVMMKNERSIIEPFLDQLIEFFDRVIVVDHASDDGSRQIVERSSSTKIAIRSLMDNGYPQSELATTCAKELFKEYNSDWVFFLDCDEFLPFRERMDLIQRLTELSFADCVYLNWRNIVPARLDGGNIFDAGFSQLSTLSRYPKIAASRNLYRTHPEFIVQQGYHGISGVPGIKLEALSSDGLYHIPVQSKLRFTAKITSSASHLIAEKKLLELGLGSHWVKHFYELIDVGIDKFDFERVGLMYPDALEVPSEIKLTKTKVKFDFPYVKSSYVENADHMLSIIEGENGQINTLVTSNKDVAFQRLGLEMNSLLHEEVAEHSIGFGDLSEILQLPPTECYSLLIEPLFSLPLKLPLTAWSGHIPFLFVLFKTMRPRNYVDLGVHFGASLIGAATAARAYQVPSQLYGIDTWAGDEHAGIYSGDAIYDDLKKFVDAEFNNVNLLRCFFDEAVEQFAPHSVDILHIDGLHSYEAVKHDFETWRSRVSPDGIVLFHDTTVRERGFGVFKYWAELESEYTSLQFFHSHGLGVLFLNDKSERLAPLIALAKNSTAIQLYHSLVSDIASLIKVRMEHLDFSASDKGASASTIAALKRLQEEKAAGIMYARALELEVQAISRSKSIGGLLRYGRR